MPAIPQDRQKNDTEDSIPLLSWFEAVLLETPEHKRTGWVFNPASLQGKLGRRTRQVRPSAEEHFSRRGVSRFQLSIFQVHQDEFGAHPTMDSTVSSDPRRQGRQTPAVADKPSEPTLDIVACFQKFATKTGLRRFQQFDGSRSTLALSTMAKPGTWLETRRDQLQVVLGRTLVVQVAIIVVAVGDNVAFKSNILDHASCHDLFTGR